MIGESGDVLRTSRLYLQHESPHGGLSTEGERSSMAEDAPVATEHGRGGRVMGTVRGTVPRGAFQRNSSSVGSMSSLPYDREVVRCPRARHVLWRYSDMLCTLTLRSLRSADSCWALTTACVEGFIIGCLKPCTISSRRQSFRTSLASQMASEAKRKVGGRVTGCALNLGELS
jgi:hypothetical protein